MITEISYILFQYSTNYDIIHFWIFITQKKYCIKIVDQYIYVTYNILFFGGINIFKSLILRVC